MKLWRIELNKKQPEGSGRKGVYVVMAGTPASAMRKLELYMGSAYVGQECLMNVRPAEGPVMGIEG